MKDKKIVEEKKVYSPEIIELAKVEVEALATKGYDKDAIWRFAKAAKSWCERDAQDFLMWEFVVQQMAPAEGN